MKFNSKLLLFTLLSANALVFAVDLANIADDMYVDDEDDSILEYPRKKIDLIANLTTQNLDAPINSSGYTRLFRAVTDNDLNAVNVLLNQGADPNKFVDDCGVEVITPILMATKLGLTDIALRLMQDPRTDIKVCSIDGSREIARGNFTILHYGAGTLRYKFLEVIIPELQQRMTQEEFAEFFNAKAEIYPLIKPTDPIELAKYGKTALEIVQMDYNTNKRLLKITQDSFFKNKALMNVEQLENIKREIQKYQIRIKEHEKTIAVLEKYAPQINNN